MEAADAMLHNLNDEGIKSIKGLELIGRIMSVFQRRTRQESEIDIVLFDDHVWTRGGRAGSRSDQHSGRCCCDRGCSRSTENRVDA